MDEQLSKIPCVRFEVEKVIGVSSDGNYQVQWAPAWVSKFHLVGCEHLIQEFLQQQKELSQPQEQQQKPKQPEQQPQEQQPIQQQPQHQQPEQEGEENQHLHRKQQQQHQETNEVGDDLSFQFNEDGQSNYETRLSFSEDESPLTEAPNTTYVEVKVEDVEEEYMNELCDINPQLQSTQDDTDDSSVYHSVDDESFATHSNKVTLLLLAIYRVGQKKQISNYQRFNTYPLSFQQPLRINL